MKLVKRMITRIGDVFEVDLGGGVRKYFQFVAVDLTQLNSDVIRVFQTTYSQDQSPSLENIVKDEVQFYAHCVTKLGIKLGYWQRLGNVAEVGTVDVLFRSSGDSGNPKVHTSEKWWVWRVNEQQVFVGRLEGAHRDAEIGLVVNPADIVNRMKSGNYEFFYPGFE